MEDICEGQTLVSTQTLQQLGVKRQTMQQDNTQKLNKNSFLITVSHLIC